MKLSKTVINIFKILVVFIWVISGSCKTSPTTDPEPPITLNPDKGSPGDIIEIKGAGFGNDPGAVTVTFNGVEAGTLMVTDTLIKTLVPVDAGTGLVVMTIGDRIITGPEFTYIPILHNIIGLSLYKGTQDDVIVIEGKNFGDDISRISVSFNDKPAIVKSVFDSRIETIVPENAGTGFIIVTKDTIQIKGPEFTYIEPNPADMFTEAKYICEGSKPAIALDVQKRIFHLSYIDGDKLMYRVGDMNGNFSNAETVLVSKFGNAIWQPVIVLDKNGNPHITVKDGKNQYGGTYTYYTNKIKGYWFEPLVVIDINNDNKAGVYNSFLTVDGNSVFMTIFVMDRNGPSNAFVRIDDVDANPVIGIKKFTNEFAVAYPYIKENGELWIFHGIGAWASYWGVEKFDKNSMSGAGNIIKFLSGQNGEQVRWLYDRKDELHAAGCTTRRNNRYREGWYQTLSRAESGLKPIKYRTTNYHANGGAQPVRDLIAADRVYVTYWNGVFDTDEFGVNGENPYGCTVENQINFMRVENGEKVNEGRKITSRASVIHGTSYRTGPAAVAHPDGGMVVVFPECGDENSAGTLYKGSMKLFYTHIGKLD